MNENFYTLNEEFKRIHNLGWIKSKSHGSGNVGITFEYLLGKERENFPIADYNGIEIKTNIENFSRQYITLFSAEPDGKYIFQTQILKEKYGKNDLNSQNNKTFYARIVANKLTLINNYYMKIELNYNTNKLILKIFNAKLKLIDEDCFWDFTTLKEKIEKKMKYLAYIIAEKKYTKTGVYFYYKDISFYKINDFENFLKLISNGTIKICFKVGIYKKGPKIGKTYDHGTGFEINKKDILKLYKQIAIQNRGQGESTKKR